MDEIEIEIYRGDSLELLVTAVNEDDGLPVDLTGATFRLTIGSTITEATSGVTITGHDALGTVDVFATYTAMDTLEVGEYNIALEATWSATGKRDTLFMGILVLAEDVCR
jgi:hypothetical protein